MRREVPSKELKRLGTSTSWVFFAHFAANASSVLMNWLLIRTYGLATHSEITVLISIMTTVTLVADLGLASKSGIRQLAKLREGDLRELARYTNSVVLLLLGLAVGSSALILAFSSFIAHRYHLDSLSIAMLSVWVLGSTVQRVYAMLVIGFEEMHHLVLLTFLSQVVLCLWSVVAFFCNLPLSGLYWGWAAAWCLTVAAGAVVAGGLMRKNAVPLFRCFLSAAKLCGAVKEAIAYFIPALCSTGLPAICFILASDYVGDRLSVLQVCYTLALVGRIVSQPIAVALLPVLSRMDIQRDLAAQTGIVLHQVSRFFCFVMLLVFMATWTCGEWVLRYYGPEYTTGLYALVLFTVCVAIEGYKSQLDQALMASTYVNLTAGLEVTKIVMIGIGLRLFARQDDLLSLPLVLLGATLVTTLVRVLFFSKVYGESGHRSAFAMLLVFGLISLAVIITEDRWFALYVGLPSILIFRFVTIAEMKNLGRQCLERVAGPRV